jgi:hypothetical protein
MKRSAIFVTALLLCAAGMAQAAPQWDKRAPVPVVKRVQAVKPEAQNLQAEVNAEYQGLKGEASFQVLSGVQANQLAGTDAKPAADKEDAPKKTGFIVNLLPACVDNCEVVDVQLQLELSNPPGHGEHENTYQLQTEVRVKKGQKTVIARKPALIELTITDAD